MQKLSMLAALSAAFLVSSTNAEIREADVTGGRVTGVPFDELERDLTRPSDRPQTTGRAKFSRVPPGREAVGAAHGSELPYVFGTLSTAARAANAPKYDSADAIVSDQMQRYWTNFAKGGDPNGSSLPHWSKFDPTARAYIDFTANGPVLREGLRREACDLFIENIKGN